MVEYRRIECCDRCKSKDISEGSFSAIHGYHYICQNCGYTCWGGRLKNKGKNEKRPPCPSPSDLDINCCQLCHLPKRNLGFRETLEIHHLDCDPKNNDRTNLLVVCTHHHKWIHHELVYHYEHFMQLAEVVNTALGEQKTEDADTIWDKISTIRSEIEDIKSDYLLDDSDLMLACNEGKIQTIIDLKAPESWRK